MGFLDKAKAAANDLAAKADTAMAGSGLGGPGGASGGQPDKLFRDLGVLAYLEATGRQAPEGERERVMGTLREAEQAGRIPSFALQTAEAGPGSVPPPPGAAAQQAARAHPPAPSMAPPPPGAPVPNAPVTPSAPPPPPPSWAKSDDG